MPDEKPTIKGPLARVLRFLPRLWDNWISLTGTALTTVAGNAFLIFFVVDVVTGLGTQYATTLGYLIFPFLFVIGLVIIAIGMWFGPRRTEGPIRRAIENLLSEKTARRRIGFVVIGTIVNIGLVSIAAYKGVTYTSSVEFCGKLCHSAMTPEYRGYQNSPHSRIACVDCHVGSGADYFLKSKLAGMRQVWGITTGDFSRPIPTPLHNLRPAQQTCEKCHWPGKLHGSRLLIRHQYKDDEKNTRETNVVLLHTGGYDSRYGKYVGIHWHVSAGIEVVYDAYDRKRSKIGKVLVKKDGKVVKVYNPPKPGKGEGKDKAATKTPDKVYETRTMDCVDCHNRPTHTFALSPKRAVDQALTMGKIDRALPYIRREAVKLLQDVKRDPQQAAQAYTAALRGFYQKNHPEVANKMGKAIDKAGRELGWIYRSNIYPDLKIAWDSYETHIGHRATTEGCFRCHDDEHATAKGEELSQDCELCHDVIAEEEENPEIPDALRRLGQP